jgi:hypothetical protein
MRSIVAAVSSRRGAFDGGDTVAAMGSVKQGLAVYKVFSSGWLSLRSCLGAAELFPCGFRTLPRRARGFSRGAEPLGIWWVVFLRSVSSSFFRERLSLLPRANCYPQAAGKIAAPAL